MSQNQNQPQEVKRIQCIHCNQGKEQCFHCKGSGRQNRFECFHCKGAGSKVCHWCNGTMIVEYTGSGCCTML